VAVIGISVDPAIRVVSVTVSADLSSLIPGVLPFQGAYQIMGIADAHIDGRYRMYFEAKTAKAIVLSFWMYIRGNKHP
jgi:hypothetical protein